MLSVCPPLYKTLLNKTFTKIFDQQSTDLLNKVTFVLLLNAELARSAVGRLASGISQLGTEAVADGIIKIAVARMVSAIKEIAPRVIEKESPI